MSRVALVLVSHSAKLAAGCVELAGQMAPDVVIVGCGGTEEGLGTNFADITAAVERVTQGGGNAVIITDLGSAVLTTETVLEFLETHVRERVEWVDAPFVEGAVVAAIEAQAGASRAGVVEAARAAWQQGEASSALEPGDDDAVGTAVLANGLGLHARPAALVAEQARRFDATVWINGAAADRVLDLMKLGATGGTTVEVRARGPAAHEAVETVCSLLASGFGEG